MDSSAYIRDADSSTNSFSSSVHSKLSVIPFSKLMIEENINQAVLPLGRQDSLIINLNNFIYSKTSALDIIDLDDDFLE